MKRHFYLISTINARVNGWTCFGDSEDKDELVKLADSIWTPTRDIYDETYYRNYRIVGKTEAKKLKVEF